MFGSGGVFHRSRLMCRPEDIPAGKGADLFAAEVSEHVRLIMGLLRNIAFEREDYKL